MPTCSAASCPCCAASCWLTSLNWASASARSAASCCAHSVRLASRERSASKAMEASEKRSSARARCAASCPARSCSMEQSVKARVTAASSERHPRRSQMQRAASGTTGAHRCSTMQHAKQHRAALGWAGDGSPPRPPRGCAPPPGPSAGRRCGPRCRRAAEPRGSPTPAGCPAAHAPRPAACSGGGGGRRGGEEQLGREADGLPACQHASAEHGGAVERPARKAQRCQGIGVGT